MKITQEQRVILRHLRMGTSELGMNFRNVFYAIAEDHVMGPLERYETLMDVKSPLMDEVRAHLIAELLIA